jgi:transcriptional regulator with XRE-family HTH domain
LSPPVTRASIANLELGRQRVLVHTLVQLAHILDVPAAELLSSDGDESVSWRTVEDALQATLHLSHTKAVRLARRLEASS